MNKIFVAITTLGAAACFELPEIEAPFDGGADSLDAGLQAPPPPPLVWLRSPDPHRPVPFNVRWLHVGMDPAPELWPDELFLESEGALVPVAVRSRLAGSALVALAEPLRPSTRYHLMSPEGRAEQETGFVTSATIADLVPPRVTATVALTLGDQLAFDVFATEAIRAEGDLRDRSGRFVRLRSAPLVGPIVRLEPEELLPPREEVVLTIFIEDLAAQPARALTLLTRTPGAIDLRITEVVASPLRDWGDTTSDGEPFDPWPGQGTVSSADEWIELVNRGEEPVDLDAQLLELRSIDGSPSVTSLAGALALRFGSGGSRRRWGVGEALVVRARGDMAAREGVLELWAGRRLLDRVSWGPSEDADHPGGAPPDAVHEAIGRTATGQWRWCAPTPGDPGPPVDCAL